MFEILDGNYKSGLMNISARYFGADQPVYVHFDYGPHHAKVFLCICIFQKQTSSSKGRTKAEAEQFASHKMLNKIEHCFFKKIERQWVFSPDKKHALLPEKTLALLGDLAHDPRHEVLSLYGDALLRYFIVRYLFDEYTQFPEGTLTRITSEALKEETRARIAQHLSLNQLIPGETTPKKLARILTAAIGKLACADSEISSRNLVMEHYKDLIDQAVANILRDHMLMGEVALTAQISTQIHNFKNELQDYTQGKGKAIALPTYTLISQEGSAHEPSFTVACNCTDHKTTGTGKTRKSAEQEAACKMLTLVHQRDAASTRVVATSKSYASHESRVKRFKAPDLSKLKRSIRWPYFESLDHLQLAFTHPSQNADDNYQRLEFLGDAILKKVLLAHLLKSYSALCDKAMLSPAVDQLISAKTQAQIAIGFNLGDYIYTQADLSETILGDVLEALIASIYLDSETGAPDTFDISRKNPAEKIVSWFQKTITLVFDKPLARSPIFEELRRFSAKPQSHKYRNTDNPLDLEAESGNSLRKSPARSQPIDNPEEFAAQNGYILQRIAGDGNCFFAAIAFLLNNRDGTSLTAADIRRNSIAYFRQFPELHVGFDLGGELGTIEEYIQKMEKDGVWAIGPIIDAVALYYHIPLRIVDFRSNGDMYHISVHEIPGLSPCLLARTGENEKMQHYSAFFTSQASLQKNPVDKIYKADKGHKPSDNSFRALFLDSTCKSTQLPADAAENFPALQVKLPKPEPEAKKPRMEL